MSNLPEDEELLPPNCPACEEPMHFVWARGRVSLRGQATLFREYECSEHGAFHLSDGTPLMPGPIPVSSR